MKFVRKKCIICSKHFLIKAFRIKQGRGKVCSISCRIELQKTFVTGDANNRWKGGTISRDGYKFIKSPNHPFANSLGYVREHRLVVEKDIGRFLKPEEKIHHLNHNRSDNRIENLQIVSIAEHNRIHNIGRKHTKAHRKFISQFMRNFRKKKFWNKYSHTSKSRNIFRK